MGKKGGYIFYYGWARKFNFVNGNVDDTIKFLLDITGYDWIDEPEFRSEFKKKLQEQGVSVPDEDALIDEVEKQVDFKPWWND